MSENPYPYDDGTYVEAVLGLEGEMDDLVDKMWKAGASPDDIRNEVKDAMENALLSRSGPKIERSLRPKPKRN